MAIPTKDELLVAYAGNMNSRLTSGYGTYGVTEEQAQQLTALFTPYQAAYTLMMSSREAGTRSKSQTGVTAAAKKALLAHARMIYASVQANTTVADNLKTLLGVEIRKENRRPVPAPTQRPMVEIVSALTRTVTINVYDPASKTKRGKLPTAVSANVYSYAGATYPADPTLWQYCGPATKANFQIAFPDTMPGGQTVWICAAWVTRRGDVGPVSVPISTNVQGGGQNETQAAIKIAA